jgi:hypothetical protein
VVTWVEIFTVLVLAHLCGDFLLQTEWQALNKHGGLAGDREHRRALLSHVAWYALPFVPVFIWIGHQHGTGMALAGAAIVLVTHAVQDDGRLLVTYMRVVKKVSSPSNTALWMAVDQSFHAVVLFGVALLVATG